MSALVYPAPFSNLKDFSSLIVFHVLSAALVYSLNILKNHHQKFHARTIGGHSIIVSREPASLGSMANVPLAQK